MRVLEGQAAIVTGASRGIGRAAARRLADAGAGVIVHATDRGRLAAVLAEIGECGGRAFAVAGDIADPGVAALLAETAREQFGRIDILVNNAGINLRSATLEMALDDWQRVLDVNLNGTLHACRSVLPGMIAQGGGRIVNVSSTAAKTPHRNAAPAYGASKAAVNYLTMHLAREMAAHNIRVNAVCPGPVETDMTSEWDEGYRARVSGQVPLGRLGTAREIADVILFLASDASGFVTGETLNANGGTFIA